MDWEGIKLVERLIQILLVIVAIISVSYAFVNEWFPYTTFGMIGGFGLATLIAVPDWPCFNWHPIEWIDALDMKDEKKEFEKRKKRKKNKSNKDNSQNNSNQTKQKQNKQKQQKGNKQNVSKRKAGNKPQDTS